MDDQALFPSINIERSGNVIFELLVESVVVYENIDILELSRYVAAALKEDVVLKHGLSEFVMRRKHKKGPHPTVYAYEMGFVCKNDDSSSWVKAAKVPYEKEARKLFASAVSEDVKCVMRNHLFRFRDKYYC